MNAPLVSMVPRVCAQYLRIEGERTSAKEIEKPSAGQPMGFVARDSEPEAGHAVMISSALPMSISTAPPRRVFPVRAKKKTKAYAGQRHNALDLWGEAQRKGTQGAAGQVRRNVVIVAPEEAGEARR